MTAENTGELMLRFLEGRLSRRDFVRRAFALGLSATSVGALLAACGGAATPSGEAPAPTTAEAPAPTTAEAPAPTTAEAPVAETAAEDHATHTPAPSEATAATTSEPAAGGASTGSPIFHAEYVGPRVSDPGRYPVTKEKVTFKVLIQTNPSVTDFETNEFTKWYEERTNVHVDWQIVPGEDAMNKLNVMLASGDLPDIIMGFGITGSQLLLYGSQGVFLPLNDLIEQHAPEIKHAFTDYPQIVDIITASDGKIYSIPHTNDCFHCNGSRKLWIYKPWLEKVGLALPTTTAEFEAVLKAFKEQDPNGNGTADEIPLISATDSWNGTLDNYFMGSFLYSPGKPWLRLNQGKVEPAYAQPEWRDAMKYLNGLYKQGLIAEESFTQDRVQLQQIGNNPDVPVAGAVPTGWWGEFMTVDQEKGGRWTDYVCVPPLKGPGGAQIAAWNHFGAAGPGAFVVTKACKNPDVAVRWADGMYDLEATLFSVHGVPGKDWRWAEEGEIGINGKQALWKQLVTWGNVWNDSWMQTGITYRSSDFRLGEAVDQSKPTFENGLYLATKNCYEPYQEPQEMQLPPIYFTQDQANQIAEQEATITQYVEQQFTAFITGQADIDSGWEEYLSTLNGMGLDAYVKVYQDAYSARPKA